MNPLLLLVATVLIAAIMLFAIWWTKKVTNFAVGNKHQWISEILETREPPSGWHGRINRKKTILKKIDRLISYLETTSLVQSQNDRLEIMAELIDIRNEWENHTE